MEKEKPHRVSYYEWTVGGPLKKLIGPQSTKQDRPSVSLCRISLPYLDIWILGLDYGTRSTSF
jgi:hypothetical protein